MRTLVTACLLSAAIVGSLPAAPPHKTPPPKNHTVALLAGAALHLSQNARSLQSAALKKREKAYGPNDPEVKAGHRNLRVIRQKQRYFRHVKRSSEGRKSPTHK